jgi:hypothetical protein
MKHPRACQIVSADQSFLSANFNRLHVPGAGRTHAGTAGGYLEPVIYSITLAVSSPPSTCTYGLQVYGQNTDAIPIFKALDVCDADLSASIHITFPNGLPCRQMIDVGSLLPANTAGCAVLWRQKESTSTTTISTDISFCPSIEVIFPGDVPTEYHLSVTYGYAHQAELQP